MVGRSGIGVVFLQGGAGMVKEKGDFIDAHKELAVQ